MTCRGFEAICSNDEAREMKKIIEEFNVPVWKCMLPKTIKGMTNEEALVFLNSLECHVNEDEKEALGIAIDAIKKQIPKNTIHFTVFDGINLKYIGQCPRCGGGINSDQSWCSNCGQAIDWSDEE